MHGSRFPFILIVASFFGLLWPDYISVSRLVLRSLIGSSRVHLCHDSRVGHVSQSGRQDVTLCSRLALSRHFSIARLYRRVSSFFSGALHWSVRLFRSCLGPSQAATDFSILLLCPSVSH